MQTIEIDLNSSTEVRAVEGEHNANAVCIKLPDELQGYPVYIVRCIDGYGRVSDSPQLRSEDNMITMILTEDILRGSKLKCQVIGFSNDGAELSKSEIFIISVSPSLHLGAEEKKKSNDLLVEMVHVLERASEVVTDAENAVNSANDAVLKAENAVETADQAVKNTESASQKANIAADNAEQAAAEARNAAKVITDGLVSGTFKGEKGDPGETPIRGVDYWTDVDKQAVKESVLNELLREDEVRY